MIYTSKGGVVVQEVEKPLVDPQDLKLSQGCPSRLGRSISESGCSDGDEISGYRSGSHSDHED